MLKYYVCWLLLMSAVTFFLMGWDKHLARSRRRRIPERVLLGWAAAGGALGGGLRRGTQRLYARGRGL